MGGESLFGLEGAQSRLGTRTHASVDWAWILSVTHEGGVRLEKRHAAQLVTRSPRRTLDHSPAPIAKHAARERRRAHRRRPSGEFGPCAGRKGADKVTMRRELAQISAHIRQSCFSG